MRLIPAAAAAATIATALTLAPTPAHAADDPLICIKTGATGVGPHTIDPPDPCIL